MDSTGAGSYEHLVAKALSEALLK
ncbi:MAG: hypothetical protein QG671_2897, partial [Actinomycetota bacterium]|nr:hypothetical protein [Actinomycetota bacterium]